MTDDEAFLRAIANDLGDDAPRLVYADWLEDRDDKRAEFLRLQEAFACNTLGTPGYAELCRREQELVRDLDPAWLIRVRRYTTPAPCRDIAALVPELRSFARTTTRLHPHRASGTLPAWASKIGGRFLWPSVEAWTRCELCVTDLAPVLQLRRRDVPDTAFPAGTDLMQLFWCADDAAHDYEPVPRVWWRDEASVIRPREDVPDNVSFERALESEGFAPLECAIYPERVVEYPIPDDLFALTEEEQARRIMGLVDEMDLGPADDLGDRLTGEYAFDTAHALAVCELGGCPGSKVGGKPGFERDGQRFEHLLTLSTWEQDVGSFRRWMAAEDQRLLAMPGCVLTSERYVDVRATQLQEPLGANFGSAQRVNVYVCRNCEPWEVVAYVGE